MFQVKIGMSMKKREGIESLLIYLEVSDISWYSEKEMNEYNVYFSSSVVDLPVKLQNALNAEIIDSYMVRRGIKI